MRVLSGDIGGTHTRLAEVETEETAFRIERLEVYGSQKHQSLGEMVDSFRSGSTAVFDAACFGVAGPVRSGKARVTNLPWRVGANDLGRQVEAPTLVINDLEALAWSVPVLTAEETEVLKEGAIDPEGNGAVIAPGTGLGGAGLFWSGSGLHPFPSEVGHTEFAPVTGQEHGLQTFLATRYGHVSWERVVSGPGLVAIHQFLSESDPTRTSPGCPVGVAQGDSDDPSAITKAAREGRCPACAQAVEQFCRSLGSQAGNLALTLGATRGIWIGGGIAPDIVDLLRASGFRDGFTGKGRMRSLMEEIPVWIIMDETAGLRGAARCAAGTVR